MRKLEKLNVDELRELVTERWPTYTGRIGFRPQEAFDELARRLALKDHDLLLERDRAEKAEKELNEVQTAYQAAHSELETSNNQLGACRRVANDLRDQVKMLVEALEEPMKRINNIKKNSTGEPSVWNVIRITGDEIKVLQEALTKIKEES